MKFLLIMFGLFSVSTVNAKSEIKMNPYGQFYEDKSGLLSVKIALLEEKNKAGLHDMIIVMSGFLAYREGIDRKAILYKTVKSGNGFDVRFKKDGKEYNRIVSRKKWGNGSYMTVYFGGLGVDIFENPSQSQSVRPLHLRTALNSKKKKKEEKLEFNPHGIAISSKDGILKAELAMFVEKNSAGRNDILLKLTGRNAYEAGLDKKVLRYSGEPYGKGGIEYSYMKGKDKRYIMRSKGPWSGEMFEVYLNGNTYRLQIAPYGSGSVRPLHLNTAYKKSKK